MTVDPRPTDEEPHTAVEESEPDYRFTLANERTFLAWVRTSLALLATAVAIVHLVPGMLVPVARHLVGGVLIVLAISATGAGLHRWGRVDAAMRRGLPLPRHRIPVYLAAGLILVSVLAFTFVAGGVVSS
jgi:putative membrane protein